MIKAITPNPHKRIWVMGRRPREKDLPIELKGEEISSI
jgi:hypothetical protein